MANSLLTISQITNEALVILENNLSFTKTVNREYDDQFARSGAKIGNTVNIRKPVQYSIGRTPTINLNSTVESSVPLVLDTQYNCGVAFNSQDLTLSIDLFSERILAPQMAALYNAIDYDGLQLYKKVYQSVGTPGATPSSLETYLNAGVKLDNAAAPNDGMRYTAINPAAQAKAVVAGQQFFNPAGDISEQYRKGRMGMFGGTDWAMDQNIGVQTIGVYAATNGTMTVTTAVASGTASVVTGGWTSGDLLNEGDIVTFSGVYAVNPQNRQSTGQLQQFVLTATPSAASGGGAMTLAISPTPQFSGNYQNVTSATGTIASGATITVYGASATSTPQNMVYHRDAFTFACADLEMPTGAVGGARKSSKKLGLSVRMQPFYDGINDLNYWRLDLLGGWKCIRPELACRVAG